MKNYKMIKNQIISKMKKKQKKSRNQNLKSRKRRKIKKRIIMLRILMKKQMKKKEEKERMSKVKRMSGINKKIKMNKNNEKVISLAILQLKANQIQ